MTGWFYSRRDVAQARDIAVGVGGEGDVVDGGVLQLYMRGDVSFDRGPRLHFVQLCPVLGKL